MIIDPSGRGPSMRQLGLAGVVMLVVAGLLLYLLMLRYIGYFEDKVDVTALLTTTGDGLPPQADVKFRGVIIGAVAEVDIAAKGEIQHVDMDLDPHFAKGIPSNVTARVIPASIFGVTAVEFVDNGPAPAGLHNGAAIPEDTSEGTIALQSTLTTLRNVLDHIQPQKLGRVLGTLADAFDPEARVPGSTIERLDTWLTTIDAAIPDLGKLLGDFGKATAGLNQSAPELIDVLGESVTTAKTLTDRRANLVALLTTASGTVDTVNALFARSPDAGKELTVGLNQLFGTLAADPEAIPFTAANLNTALHKLATTFHWGPKKQMVWSMDISTTPFQQYTAKDCPHYADMYGPRCGGSSVPSVAPPQVYPPQMLPASLRGPAAVQALVGSQPNASQLLLLGPALAGGSVTAAPVPEGGN